LPFALLLQLLSVQN